MLKIATTVFAVLFVVIVVYGIMYLLTFNSQKLPTVNQIVLDDNLEVGKWMLTADGTPANWLRQKYQGKELREPVNVILIDESAGSADEAIRYMLDSFAKIGYDSRKIHSSGYLSQIGGAIYDQYPQELNQAFSNALYILPNNHGRIFGPHYQENKYYFSGAFSREGIDIFAEVKHVYISFNVARDDFAARLDGGAYYRLAGKYNLANSIDDEDSLTTGDHDGSAVVLVRKHQKSEFY